MKLIFKKCLELVNGDQKKFLFWSMIGAIVAYGIYLRFINTFSFDTINLYFDEAITAASVSKGLLNVISDYGFVRPAIYSAFVKLSVLLLGNDDFAYRFFPFVCSVVSIFLFLYLVLRIFDNKVITCVLVSFFCFNQHMIYHAGESKAFSYVILISLLVILSMIFYIKKGQIKSIIFLLLVSVFSPLVAMELAFILPAIFIVLLVNEIFSKNYKRLAVIIGAGILSLCVFIGYYFIVKYLGGKGGLDATGWYLTTKYFIKPEQNFALFYVTLFYETIKIFILPRGFFDFSWLIEICCSLLIFSFIVIGCRSLVDSKERRFYFLLFSIPFIIVIFFNILKMWPFGATRSNLFLIPSLLFLLGFGFDYLLKNIYSVEIRKVIGSIIVFFCVFLVFPFDADFYSKKVSDEHIAATNAKAVIKDIAFSGISIGEKNLLIVNAEAYQSLLYYIRYNREIVRYNARWLNATTIIPVGVSKLINENSIKKMISDAEQAKKYDNIFIMWDRTGGDTYEYLQTYFKDRSDFMKVYTSTLWVRLKK